VNPYAAIPQAIRRELIAYVEEGHRPNATLRAVLENNLGSAITQADAGTLAAMRPLLIFITNALPARCHGSAAQVREWMAALAGGGSTILAKHADLLDGCGWSEWKAKLEAVPA
jgi:hypothetical protein